MTGINLIKKEREKQLSKYSVDNDTKNYYSNSELSMLAVWCLTLNNDFYPSRFGKEYRIKLANKTWIERCTIAGALCAAQIDILNKI